MDSFWILFCSSLPFKLPDKGNSMGFLNSPCNWKPCCCCPTEFLHKVSISWILLCICCDLSALSSTTGLKKTALLSAVSLARSSDISAESYISARVKFILDISSSHYWKRSHVRCWLKWSTLFDTFQNIFCLFNVVTTAGKFVKWMKFYSSTWHIM